MSSFWLCLRIFVVAHRRFLLAWSLSQVALFLALRHALPFSGQKSDILSYLAFGLAYAMSFYGLVAYLGLAFNSHRKQSWLRQLPFSTQALAMVPLCLILIGSLWYLVTLYALWKNSYLYTGTTITNPLFVLPFFNFYILRRARHPLRGAFLAAALSLIYIFLQINVLMAWNAAQYGVISELPYLLLLLLLGLFLEKESPRSTIAVTTVATLAVLSFPLISALASPQSLSQVILDLKIYPSPAAIDHFRRYTTDQSYWRSEPGKEQLVAPFNKIRQELADEFLTEHQRRLYLQNILDHAENFRSQDQYRAPDELDDPFPLDAKKLGDEATRYLVENWRDEEAYCFFLPKAFKERYLRLALASQACAKDSLHRFFWDQPYPHISAEDTATLASFLKTPRHPWPQAVKVSLSRIIQSHAAWPDNLRARYDAQNWFVDQAMTDEDIALFNTYYAYNIRQDLAHWLRGRRDSFVQNVLALAAIPDSSATIDHDQDQQRRRVLTYLCHHVSQHCDGEVGRSKRQDIFYIKDRHFRLRHLQQGAARAESLYQLGQELIKLEHWQMLQALPMP